MVSQSSELRLSSELNSILNRKYNIDEIPQELINGTLEEQKEKYLNLVKEARGESEINDTLFVWTNSFLTIHIFTYENLEGSIRNLIIATKNNSKDEIKFHNLNEEEMGLDFKSTHNADVKLSILDHKMLLPMEVESIVFYNRLILSRIKNFGMDLFRDEYRKASTHFVKKPIELLNFNSIRLHADKYKMADMIEELNNPQFTAELGECLFAYENEKFYICATGIGGLIEHMIHLAIEKHGRPDSVKGNPTTDSYIGILRKDPFNVDKRAATYIRTIMGFRNSVSHFNSGFTSKEICDHLFDGLKNVYINYYLTDPTSTVSN